MIVDKLANFSSYAHLRKHFETAAKFVSETDLSKLPLGRTEVDGENVYDRSDMFWESSQKVRGCADHSDPPLAASYNENSYTSQMVRTIKYFAELN